MGAGVEEPSCLVELLGENAAGNHAATTVRLRPRLAGKIGQLLAFAQF